MRILVVEDDKHLAGAVRRGLRRGLRRRRRARRHRRRTGWPPRTPTTRWCSTSMLPGHERPRSVRARCATAGDWTPILMLTARTGDERGGPGARRGRRRLPGQAVLVRRAARPAARAAAPRRPGAAGRAGGRGPAARPGRAPGLARRRAGRADARGSSPCWSSSCGAPARSSPRPGSSSTSGTSPSTATPTSSRSTSGSCGCASTSRSAGPPADGARRGLPARRRRWLTVAGGAAGSVVRTDRAGHGRLRHCLVLGAGLLLFTLDQSPAPAPATTWRAAGCTTWRRRPKQGNLSASLEQHRRRQRRRRPGVRRPRHGAGRRPPNIAGQAAHLPTARTTGAPEQRIAAWRSRRRRGRGLPGLGVERRRRRRARSRCLAGASLESVSEASRTLRARPRRRRAPAHRAGCPRHLAGHRPDAAPVEDIRTEVAAIADDEPDRRVPVPAADDEISRLAATMNQMLARLEDAQPQAAGLRRRRLPRAAEPDHGAAHAARGRAGPPGGRLARSGHPAAGGHRRDGTAGPRPVVPRPYVVTERGRSATTS